METHENKIIRYSIVSAAALAVAIPVFCHDSLLRRQVLARALRLPRIKTGRLS